MYFLPIYIYISFMAQKLSLAQNAIFHHLSPFKYYYNNYCKSLQHNVRNLRTTERISVSNLHEPVGKVCNIHNIILLRVFF